MKLENVQSKVVPLLVDHVDTDQIIPARFLTTTTREGLGDQLFADWKKDPEFVLNQPEHAGKEILLAAENFGCGSSREHAPWALLAGGFKVVIARSFADIFHANALRNGLLTVQASPEDHAKLVAAQKADPELSLDVDLPSEKVSYGSETFSFSIDPFAKDCLLRGVDRIGYLVEKIPEIERFEATHA